MKKSKIWLRCFFIFVFVLISSITLFNYVVDPYQYYRSAPYRKYYSGEQRWQAPGLAQNYHYDNIVLGTSMTENFLPSRVNNIFDTEHTMKLSISGSSMYEQRLIAELAFNSKNEIKNVIWEVYFSSLSYDVNYVSDVFPMFLYDKNKINDLKYLFNLTTTKESIRYIFDNIGLGDLISYLFVMKNNPERELEYLNFWGNDVVFGREKALEDYEQNRENRNDQAIVYRVEPMKANIDNNIIPFIKENPSTNFYFFYPPLSILANKSIYERNSQNIENIISVRKYFFEQIKDFDNAFLYDFSTDQDIIFNLDNYKDMGHYSPEINQFILDSIAKGDKHKVTEDNINKFLDDFISQAEDYEVDWVMPQE